MKIWEIQKVEFHKAIQEMKIIIFSLIKGTSFRNNNFFILINELQMTKLIFKELGKV